MAGQDNAILAGCAIPVFGPAGQLADHTYVVTSCGLRWGCFGRDGGGSHVAMASGSSRVAACLARTDGTAGIRYGITGVCHQAANRILDPAGVTVMAANGYALSWLAYGDYGLGAWPERQACSGGPGNGGQPPPNGFPRLGSASMSGMVSAEADRQPRRGAERMDPEASNELEMARSELRRLLDTRLGRPVDARRFEQVLTHLARMRIEQRALVQALDAGRLGPDEYLSRLQRLVDGTAAEIRAVLGEPDYRAVFGAATFDALVQRDTFRAEFAQGADAGR